MKLHSVEGFGTSDPSGSYGLSLLPAASYGCPPKQHGMFLFSASTYVVQESGGFAIVTVRRVQGGDGAVSVIVASVDGTAIAPRDYQAVQGTVLYFAPGETNKTVAVTIVDDAVAEGVELFQLMLTDPQGGASISTGQGLNTSSSATVRIIDDDNSNAIEFASSAHAVWENATSVVLSVVANGPGSDTYRTGNMNAMAGVDYNSTTGALTFGVGGGTQQITVDLIDNRDAPRPQAQPKAFFVALLDPTNGATLGMKRVAKVTILDNDVAPPCGGSDCNGHGVCNVR